MKGLDFIAQLEFLTTAQGGRKNAVVSGYRPHIEFENYPEYITSGQQTYIEQETVNPGDKIKAEIVILSQQYFAKRLYENMTFKFSEGRHTMGYGKIIEVVNTNLKSDSTITQEAINLNLYPEDITNRIKLDFAERWNVAFSRIQELIISDETFRNNKIVRAIIYLANKDVTRLEEIIELAKIDYGDILMNAEYDKKKRVRDFENEFKE